MKTKGQIMTECAASLSEYSAGRMGIKELISKIRAGNRDLDLINNSGPRAELNINKKKSRKKK